MNSTVKGSLQDNEGRSKGRDNNVHSILRWLLVLILLGMVLGFVAMIVITEVHPFLGAQIADKVREIFGPEVVAGVETMVFRLQDILKNVWYKFNPGQAESPWVNDTGLAVSTSSVTPHATIESPTPQHQPHIPVPTEVAQIPSITTQPMHPKEQDLTKALSPSVTPTTYSWFLPALEPFGTVQGEGVWQPYLYDQDEGVVAQRTFLQPDPNRPYTVVAVVAFNLERTRLHFVLGFNEPSVPDGPRGDGLIPDIDRQSGTLLAAFNGGFRAANGHFGAMADGTVALPPKDEFATLGIYENGKVKIGEWGAEIVDSPELRSWRQNCRLIIDDGEISARVYNNSITDWGASINNQTVTRRSGIGLDKSAKILYYFAGPSLSMPILADAMLAVGVHNGMLLDINHFWVHFTAIRTVDGELLADPLVPDEMIDHVDRYLGPSPVDFFYLTALEPR
jgi:hypothetical protein